MTRPTCPTCGAAIDRLQRCQGVVAAYPCGCWLTPTAAQAIAEQHRRNNAGETAAEVAQAVLDAGRAP